MSVACKENPNLEFFTDSGQSYGFWQGVRISKSLFISGTIRVMTISNAYGRMRAIR